MSSDGKQVALVAIDESEESMHCLEWATEHLFKQQTGFKIILVTVKPLPISVLKFTGPGTEAMIPLVESQLKKSSDTAIAKAKEICLKRSISNFETMIVDGDARHALCEAVEKHHADILIIGSHGYGAFKRAILGSVSDYCAHHAHCSVLIVKKPKPAKDNQPAKDNH